MTTTNYQQQAIEFLNKKNAAISVKYLRTGKYFDDDKEERDIYEITLTKGQRSYTFNFGQSINNSGEYDLLDSRLIAQIGRKFCSRKELDKLRLSQYEKNANTRKNSNYSQPTAYDVLACVQKYDVGSFEDFCSEFGYDTDSRKAEKTYKAVKDEWLNISRLFNDDELQELQEIN